MSFKGWVHFFYIDKLNCITLFTRSPCYLYYRKHLCTCFLFYSQYDPSGYGFINFIEFKNSLVGFVDFSLLYIHVLFYPSLVLPAFFHLFYLHWANLLWGGGWWTRSKVMEKFSILVGALVKENMHLSKLTKLYT